MCKVIHLFVFNNCSHNVCHGIGSCAAPLCRRLNCDRMLMADCYCVNTLLSFHNCTSTSNIRFMMHTSVAHPNLHHRLTVSVVRSYLHRGLLNCLRGTVLSSSWIAASFESVVISSPKIVALFCKRVHKRPNGLLYSFRTAYHIFILNF